MKAKTENLKKEEEALNATVKQYLVSLEEGNDDSIKGSGVSLCTALTYLLAAHLEFDSSWPHEERWLDGVIDAHIHLQQPKAIVVRGRMVWGLRRDVGGDQWAEPFEAEIRISPTEGGPISYTLRFGDKRGLADKLVFGSYHVLRSDVTNMPMAKKKYSYCFKH